MKRNSRRKNNKLSKSQKKKSKRLKKRSSTKKSKKPLRRINNKLTRGGMVPSKRKRGPETSETSERNKTTKIDWKQGTSERNQTNQIDWKQGTTKRKLEEETQETQGEHGNISRKIRRREKPFDDKRYVKNPDEISVVDNQLFLARIYSNILFDMALSLQVKRTIISEKVIQEMWVSFPKPITSNKEWKEIIQDIYIYMDVNGEILLKNLNTNISIKLSEGKLKAYLLKKLKRIKNPENPTMITSLCNFFENIFTSLGILKYIIDLR